MARFSASGRFSTQTDEEKKKQELYTLAKKEGIAGPEQKKRSPNILERVFDLTARPGFAFSNAIIQGAGKEGSTKSLLERFKRAGKGAIEGFKGKAKVTPEDALIELGVPEGKSLTTPKIKLGPVQLGGKVTLRGISALPANIGLDPSTYLSFGAGTGAKITLTQGIKTAAKGAAKKAVKEGAEVTLNKGVGQSLLVNTLKKVEQQSIKEGSNLSGTAIREAALKEVSGIVSKNLNKYVDFGGIKFGGKTIAPQFQRGVGALAAKTGAPEAARKSFAAFTGPFNSGGKLIAHGYQDFYESYQNILRSPRNIARRAVDDVTRRFEQSYGRKATQAQLDEFFDLADKGLPIDINNYKPPVIEQAAKEGGLSFAPPTTPILTEVGQSLPKDFVAAIDNAAIDPGTKKLYKDYLTTIRPEMRQIALDLGLPEEKLIQDYIFRGVEEKTKKNTLKIGSPFKEKTPAQLKKRTAEEFIGTKKNPIWAMAQGLASLRTAADNNNFIKETLEKYGIKKPTGIHEIPEGMVEFQPKGGLGFFPIETAQGKVVAGVTTKVPTYYVPEEIGKTLNKFTNPKDTNKFLKIYDKILSAQKIGLTSYYPAFHVRNFIGNVFNNWVGGVTNPKDYTDAGLIQAGQFKGKIAGYSAAELKTASEDMGVLGTGFYKADVATLLEQTAKGKTLPGTIKSKIGKTINLPTILGTTIEDNAKLAHFISKIRSGSSLEEAARSTKKFLFDYSELTDFEKGTMKRIMPFYTWTRKNIPLQLEQLVKQPGKYSALGDVINSLPKGSQEDINSLPEYIRESLFVKLSGEGDSAKYGYSAGSLIPLEDLNRLWRGDIKRSLTRDVLSFVNPVFQLPLKEVAQQDFFYNKPYDQYKYDAGKQAKKALEGKPGGKELLDWLELREEKFTLKTGKDAGTEIVRYSVNPSKWELLSTSPLSRVFSTLAADNPTDQAINPFKMRTFDLATQRKINDTKSFKEFEQRLLDSGALKTFSKTYIPKTAEEEAKKKSKLRFR